LRSGATGLKFHIRVGKKFKHETEVLSYDSYPLNSQTNLRFSLKEFHKRAISTHYQIKVQRRE
jgi:hypothetical protein